MTLIAERFVLVPPDGGETLNLTRAEYDRFFDNRSPDGWRIVSLRFSTPDQAVNHEAQCQG